MEGAWETHLFLRGPELYYCAHMFQESSCMVWFIFRGQTANGMGSETSVLE